MPLQFRKQDVVPGRGPFIVGILNVTPDSFSDGGAYPTTVDAIAAGCRMADEGADAIDVGGESTRPGSQPVSADEQIRRTQPVIAELSRRWGSDGPSICIDTRSAAVARAAMDAGASVVNDVSALRHDTEMAALVAARGAGVVLMHMKGTPADMQIAPHYEDVVKEICAFLVARVGEAVKAGIPRTHIIVDPGIGFGKTTAHNLEILRRLTDLRAMGLPLMVGPSRKRFIGEILGIDKPSDRIHGTLAVVASCVLAGVECVRVHDVAACRQVADVCAALRNSSR